ncbi:GALNT [Lepeophtheirus salmonis]|uniref:GALNT n=1 Tax=Lepeophtheirus salmonis TaxID=72036 RepID=A0A7R8CPN6_LEPSM|nr:GALNT [Lepeophtheirus salmonis]CAF2884977.1 GALNT [Lepeophtheirus salmonis]
MPISSRGYEAHKSYPEEIPRFLGIGNLGNYEKSNDRIVRPRNGPGEAGKSHKLKASQRKEEDQQYLIFGRRNVPFGTIQLVCQLLPSFWYYTTRDGSTLFRTINSVINGSPPQLLKEVVLPYYKGKVVVVRNEEREGLIRNAHCEVNKNWLPPLLAPIHENRRTLSVPVIDGINWDDFSINSVYAEGSHSRGLFEWGMLYKEGNLPIKESTKRRYHSEPYNSPTHAGGLFAIDREWFKELGWYDPGLYIWGGEILNSHLKHGCAEEDLFGFHAQEWRMFIEDIPVHLVTLDP